MSGEVVTTEDLQLFRFQLINELKQFIEELKPEEKPEWLKSGDVKKMLKVSPGTLQNLRINGQLHPKKIGGVWYYSLAEIKKLFKANS